MIDHKFDIENLEEYDNHHKVVFLNNAESGLKGYIAIHRKNKKAPSFGATRLWHYEDSLDGLRDALRLSRLMSYKAALAGLPCGGAKGVILAPGDLKSQDRKRLLLSYAEEVDALNGKFITGTDAGLSRDDLKLMKGTSKFFVGLNGDAVDLTALGVLYSMETCLKFAHAGDVAGKSFAIQGLGKIGEALLNLIYSQAGKIYVTDTNKSVVKKIKKKYTKVVVVRPTAIHKQKVDIFSPCALSHSINSKTIGQLGCNMVVGGANNQLQDDSIGDVLFKLGILYAPDYLANAGGLTSVYDEFEHPGKYSRSRVEKKILAIKNRLRRVLKKSSSKKVSTNRVANEIAEKVFNSY